MISRIEPFAGAIRCYSDDLAKHGDPYDWAASVRWVDHVTIEIAGITSPPTPAMWRSIKEAARNMGG
jgi:hypothetical protein